MKSVRGGILSQPHVGGRLPSQQQMGGIAALYLASAYLAAIPYFLLALNYTSVVDPAAKLALLVEHQASLYTFNILAYIVFGLVLTVLACTLHERFIGGLPLMARIIAGWGVIWSCLLIASGMIANMGMGYVVNLYQTNASAAIAAWPIIETIVDGLGGAGGEALGGSWMLLVSIAGLRSDHLPRALNWLGIMAGIAGIISNIPLLRESAVAFGLLQIPWFIWMGIVLLRTRSQMKKP